jgi:hypothetical protein
MTGRVKRGVDNHFKPKPDNRPAFPPPSPTTYPWWPERASAQSEVGPPRSPPPPRRRSACPCPAPSPRGRPLRSRGAGGGEGGREAGRNDYDSGRPRACQDNRRTSSFLHILLPPSLPPSLPTRAVSAWPTGDRSGRTWAAASFSTF